jgi:serine/threonine protein kinase
MIGSRLGPYEITARLGEGGMGEVYRAHDSKLRRDVAIKVLPAAFTEDKERLARFEREAQLLASLNHPNIAQIYGLEAGGEGYALVTELLEGPTLAEIAAGWRGGGMAEPGARPVRLDGIPGRFRELAPNTGAR